MIRKEILASIDLGGVCKRLVIREDSDFIYLEPAIRANVKMRNWTKAGMLRNPVFAGFIW